jgi:hypothetical protein
MRICSTGCQEQKLEFVSRSQQETSAGSPIFNHRRASRSPEEGAERVRFGLHGNRTRLRSSRRPTYATSQTESHVHASTIARAAKRHGVSTPLIQHAANEEPATAWSTRPIWSCREGQQKHRRLHCLTTPNNIAETIDHRARTGLQV